MKSISKYVQWLFLTAVVFLANMAAEYKGMPGSDYSFTIAAVLAILLLIVVIFTILVSFSLRQSVAERYRLTNEIKTERTEDRMNNYQIENDNK